MRLTEKTTGPLLPAQGQPSRIKRRFDQARTPFDRLCETEAISEEQNEKLQTLRDQTYPRQLCQEIYQLIDQIFLLPGAVPGETEDVYETLFAPTGSQKGEDILVTLLFDWTRYLIGTLGFRRTIPCDGFQSGLQGQPKHNILPSCISSYSI
jgi:hypothetical protein